jgi:hypothetical protein
MEAPDGEPRDTRKTGRNTPTIHHTSQHTYHEQIDTTPRAPHTNPYASRVTIPFYKKYESATCFFPFSSSRTSSSAEPLPDASRHEWIKYGKMDDYGVRLDSLNRNSLPLHMLWRTVQNCIGPFQFSHRIPYRSVHPAAP